MAVTALFVLSALATVAIAPVPPDLSHDACSTNNENILTGFKCKVITKTSSKEFAETDSPVFIKLYDKAGRTTDWIELKKTLLTIFNLGASDEFYLHVYKVWGPITHMEVYLKGDDWWYFENIKLECPDPEVKMVFTHDKWLNANGLVKLDGKDQIFCQAVPDVRDSTRSCSRDSNVWGSRCTYTCNTGFTLVGAKCILCQASGDSAKWSSSAPNCTKYP